MNAADWTFSPAEPDDSGYRVRAVYAHARTYYGEPAPDGVGYAPAAGYLFVMPIEGHGPTPEAALADAAFQVGRDYGKHEQAMWAVACSVLGGRP